MKSNIKNSKHKKRISAKPLEWMTSSRIAAMEVIEKKESIKFLFDPITRNYVVFNNYYMSSFYSSDHNIALRFFYKHIKG